MKTILLTSAGMDIKEEILKVLPKSPEQMKVAHIITASKPEKNTSYVAKDKDAMVKEGFQVEDIDLEGKSEPELKEVLRDKDIIYVQGGNTFYLLKYAKQSGFDELVKKLIGEGKIYIGVSAGSYIACPTIEMATWKKHQDRERIGLTDLSALNLVPFLLSVHYVDEYKGILKEAISKTKYKVRILTDEQAIFVINDEIKFIGGEEIKL